MPEISKTADQALAVLQELGERGTQTPAELSRSLGINRTVVHRLLSTLRGRGFVTKQERGYAVGPALLRMAKLAQPGLREAAQRVMSELCDAIGETVVVHIADGDDAVVLDQVVSQGHVLRAHHDLGSRHPLAIGASGRALLAYLPEATIERVVESAPSPAALSRELEGIRTLGYAISHDELQHGIHGLAVPVFAAPGYAHASLAILTPTMRAPGLADHADQLKAAALEIGESLTTKGEVLSSPTAT